MKLAILDLEAQLPNVTSQYLMVRHGVMDVATAAHAAGHDVKVYVEALNGLPLDRLADRDVVGAAVTGSNLNRVAALFRGLRARAPHIKLVAGGPHATLSPTDVLAFADVAVRDEGEAAIVELLGVFASGGSPEGVRGVSYLEGGRARHTPRRPFARSAGELENLDLLDGYRRRPAWLDLLLRRQIRCGYASTSRGCPFPCTFCYENMIGGTTFRAQPEEVFIENVRRKRDRFGTRHFWLADSNFTTNPKHCRAILRRLVAAELGCTFTALCRVDVARHPDLLDLMAAAGFTTLVLGMEATDDGRLDSLDKRQTVADIDRAVAEIQARGMFLIGLFMVGFDGDTAETPHAIIEYCRRRGGDDLCLYCLSEYPSLPGRTLPRYRICEPNLDYHNGHFVTTFPRDVRPSALEAAVYDALQGFYAPTKALGRLARGQPRQALVQAGIAAQIRRMARISASRHRPYLESVEAPYYDRAGRLDVDRLRARPVISQPLRDDLLADWRDAEDGAGVDALVPMAALVRAPVAAE